MPPPWETWRQDFNDKLDRWGEEKLHLRPSHSKPLQKKNATYEERLARMRSGGGAEGAVLGQTYHRSVPPPPQPLSNEGLSVAGGASIPASQAPTASTTPLHLQFSRFTETDKQAFFALLDEYFMNRSSGGDIWLDDDFVEKILTTIGHGLCSIVSKAPFSSASVEEAGGEPGQLCIKQVDVDVQNAPHNVQHEIALLQRLRHDHLVLMLASFTTEPDHFTTVHHIAMPLYPYSLPDLLNQAWMSPTTFNLSAQSGDSRWAPVLSDHSFSSYVHSVARQLADAMSYLHQEHVAHRDIKPANIMFDNRGLLKLIDLGVAWEEGMKETPSFHQTEQQVRTTCAQISEVGTGAFRAPELLFAPQHGYDAYKADVWSWGTVMASFFTSLNEVETEECLGRSNFTSWERELFPERPSEASLELWRPRTYERSTLFDSSRGDIALACDVFKVLSLPSDVACWPEAAFFQPPLAQFPFVHQPAKESLFERLPNWHALTNDASAPAKRMSGFVKEWLPRVLSLSASQRPTAAELYTALSSP